MVETERRVKRMDRLNLGSLIFNRWIWKNNKIFPY
jgi:hypothetical protein